MSLIDGLVSYYTLDETSGTTAYDSHGNNHGTNNGATINQAGKLGRSYLFSNGAGKFVTLPFKPTTTSSTVSAWIYPTGTGGVFGTGDSKSGGKTGWEGNYDGENKRIGVSVWSGNSELGNVNSPVNSVPLNQWSFITYTQDGTAIKMYVNGVLEGSSSLSSASSAHSLNLKIGRDFMSGGGADTISGNIDEFGYWNRALTSSEIESLYNEGNGLTYPFTRYTLNLNKKGMGNEGGIISLNPDKETYDENEEVEISLSTSGPDYRFHKFEGDLEGNNNPETIIMDDDKNVDVYFQKRIKTRDGVIF